MKDEKISKNFRMSEFACHDGTPVPEKYKANVRRLVTTVLQPLRDYLGEPIYINSGYRSPAYNKRIGGAKRSQHLQGKAADITVKTLSPILLYNVLNDAMAGHNSALRIPDGGLGKYPGFTHVDIGPVRRW